MCNLVIVGEAQNQNSGSDFGLVGVCTLLSVLVTIDPKDQNTFFSDNSGVSQVNYSILFTYLCSLQLVLFSVVCLF